MPGRPSRPPTADPEQDRNTLLREVAAVALGYLSAGDVESAKATLARFLAS